MFHRAESCGCEKEIGMSKTGVAQFCEHGNLLVYVHGLSRQSLLAPATPKPQGRRKPMKRTEPKRDWSDARAKVDEEGACRVCGSNESLEAAHVIGRSSDQPKSWEAGEEGRKLYVQPDSIIPLCGAFSQLKCHARYDAHDLDVLQRLSAEEQVQATKDAGGIEAARMRTSPSSYRILREAA